MLVDVGSGQVDNEVGAGPGELVLAHQLGRQAPLQCIRRHPVAVLDLLDKSKNAVVDYYKAISGFAKDMLYGTPE